MEDLVRINAGLDARKKKDGEKLQRELREVREFLDGGEYEKARDRTQEATKALEKQSEEGEVRKSSRERLKYEEQGEEEARQRKEETVKEIRNLEEENF